MIISIGSFENKDYVCEICEIYQTGKEKKVILDRHMIIDISKGIHIRTNNMLNVLWSASEFIYTYDKGWAEAMKCNKTYICLG